MLRTMRKSPRALILALAALMAVIILSGCSALNVSTASSPPPPASGGAHAGSGALSLITEPDAGIAPVAHLILSARHVVEVVMYQFEDPALEADLAHDAAHGVRVRVLLNGGYEGGGSSENKAAYAYFKSHGVAVEWTPSYFALTHQKSVIVDGRTLAILSFNFTPQYYTTSRDFGVVDHIPADVRAAEAAFDDDWARTKATAPNGADLVWSPGSEDALVSLIESARRNVDIYNEEMKAKRVIDALRDDARRGVLVRVVMTNQSSWDTAFSELGSSGAHVRTYAEGASLYIHAKMILVDNERAFLGSENFSVGSMSYNRELGLVLQSPRIIHSLILTFDGDFDHATPFSG
jgi:phosphatidylserine/phosphatidylglycerophosphate/cardiolipin synthase-like enzyme